MCSRQDDPSQQDEQDEYEVLLYPDAKIENHGTVARATVLLDGKERWIVAEPRLLRDAILAAIDLNEPVALLVPGWALS